MSAFLLFLICHSQISESRKALSQREAELLGSSEQCRVVLEEQIADLRKQLSTTEQDLCVSKEDLRSLHQQLREKVKGGRRVGEGGGSGMGGRCRGEEGGGWVRSINRYLLMQTLDCVCMPSIDLSVQLR